MKLLLLVLLQLCLILVPSCVAQETADPAVSSSTVVSASPLTSEEIVQIILKPKLDEWTDQVGALVSSGVTSQDSQALVKAAWLQLFGLRSQVDLINESSMLSPEEKEAALTRAKAPIKGILNLAVQISASQDDHNLFVLRMIKLLCDDELLGIGDKALGERVQTTIAKAETRRGCRDWNPCLPCVHGYSLLRDCPICAPRCGWWKVPCPSDGGGGGGNNWNINDFGPEIQSTIVLGIKNGMGWLGVDLFEANGGLQITKVYPGSPAEKAGIREWDLITGIDGFSTANMSYFEFNSRIRMAGGWGSVILHYRRVPPPGLGQGGPSVLPPNVSWPPKLPPRGNLYRRR